jgi:hypothetical protein
MTYWKVLIVAALLPLASCSKPQAVTDLKASITALREAGDKATIAGYHALVTEAQTRFAAARPQLSASDAAACNDALAKAADVDLFWRDTDGIANGLTPVAEEPLTRLGVIKTKAEFGQWEANFIPLQQSMDGESADDEPAKAQNRNDLRHDLLKKAMAAAAPSLKKAEEAL